MHPFAQYIRTLGRGKRGSRDLSEDEAFNAFRMILNNETTPEQLGAFLMLIRVKEETPAELAGFVRAARSELALPDTLPAVQLDWSSYAGKRRHLPWFLLSALLLAENKITVFMHGSTGRKDNRVYTPATLKAMDLPVCESLADATQALKQHHFAFVTLEHFAPRLAQLIELREILGLRSPVHSLCRLLNPFNAPCVLQGIFHPGYKAIHRDAGLLLKQPRLAVLKGEGGEIERDPDSDCEVLSVCDGETGSETWPAMFSGARHLKDTTMDTNRLRQLWQGAIDDEYGTAAVIGTTAIALKLLQKADNQTDAMTLASTMWNDRRLERLA